MKPVLSDLLRFLCAPASDTASPGVSNGDNFNKSRLIVIFDDERDGQDLNDAVWRRYTVPLSFTFRAALVTVPYVRFDLASGAPFNILKHLQSQLLAMDAESSASESTVPPSGATKPMRIDELEVVLVCVVRSAQPLTFPPTKRIQVPPRLFALHCWSLPHASYLLEGVLSTKRRVEFCGAEHHPLCSV